MVSKSKLIKLVVSLEALKYSLLGTTSAVERFQKEIEEILGDELPNSSSEENPDGSLFPT
jgi:hypothetical protein